MTQKPNNSLEDAELRDRYNEALQQNEKLEAEIEQLRSLVPKSWSSGDEISSSNIEFRQLQSSISDANNQRARENQSNLPDIESNQSAQKIPVDSSLHSRNGNRADQSNFGRQQNNETGTTPQFVTTVQTSSTTANEIVDKVANKYVDSDMSMKERENKFVAQLEKKVAELEARNKELKQLTEFQQAENDGNSEAITYLESSVKVLRERLAENEKNEKVKQVKELETRKQSVSKAEMPMFELLETNLKEAEELKRQVRSENLALKIENAEQSAVVGALEQKLATKVDELRNLKQEEVTLKREIARLKLNRGQNLEPTSMEMQKEKYENKDELVEITQSDVKVLQCPTETDDLETELEQNEPLFAEEEPQLNDFVEVRSTVNNMEDLTYSDLEKRLKEAIQKIEILEKRLAFADKKIDEGELEILKLGQVKNTLQKELEKEFRSRKKHDLAAETAELKSRVLELDAENKIITAENATLSSSLDEKKCEIEALENMKNTMSKEIANLTENSSEIVNLGNIKQKTYSELLCENCELSAHCKTLEDSCRKFKEKYDRASAKLTLFEKEKKLLKEDISVLSVGATNGTTVDQGTLDNLMEDCGRLKAEKEVLEESNLRLCSQVRLLTKELKSTAQSVLPNNMDNRNQDDQVSLTLPTYGDGIDHQEQRNLMPHVTPIDLLVQHEKDARKIEHLEELISNYETSIEEEKSENLTLTQEMKSLRSELQDAFEPLVATDLAEDLVQIKIELSQSEAEKVLANSHSKSLSEALEEKDVEMHILGMTIAKLKNEIANLVNNYPETYLTAESNKKTYSDLVCENCELSSKCEALTNSYKKLNDKYLSLSESLELMKNENNYLNEELIMSSGAATEGVTPDDEEIGKLRQNCCKLKAENELLEEKNLELSNQMRVLFHEKQKLARHINPSMYQLKHQQPAVVTQTKELNLNEALSRALFSTTDNDLKQTEEVLLSANSKPIDSLVRHESDIRKIEQQEEKVSKCENVIAEKNVENLRLTQTIKSLQRELQNSFECFGAKDLAEDLAQTKTQLSQSEAEKVLCNTENKNLTQALEEKDVEVLTLGTTITSLKKEFANLTNKYPETHLAEENNQKTYSGLVCGNCELSSKCEALRSSNKRLNDNYRSLSESLDLVKKENFHLNEELIKSSAAVTEGFTLEDEETVKLRQNCCKLKAENQLLEEKNVELSVQMLLLSNQTKQLTRHVNPSMDQLQQEQPAVSIQTKEHSLNEGLSRAVSSTTDDVLTQTEDGLPSTISKPTDLLVWHEKNNRKFVKQEEQISNCEKAIAEEKIENLKLTQAIKSLQRELQNSFDCFGAQGLAEDLAQTKTQLSQSEAEKALCNTENKNLTQALEEKDVEVLTLGTTITSLKKEFANLTNKYPETHLAEGNNQKTYSDLVCENCDLSSKCEALTSSNKMLNDKYRSRSESLDLVKKENIYLNEELIKSSAAATEGVTLDDEETGKLRQNCCKLKAENELLEEKNVELSCQILLLSNQKKQFARYVNPSIDQSQDEQPAVSIQNKEHSLNEGLSRAFSSTTGDVLTQTEEGLPSTISKPTDLLVWHEKGNRKFVEQEEQISNCEKALAEEKIENLKLTQTIKSLQRELQNSFECFGAKDLAEDMAQTKTQLSQSEAEKALCNTENKNLSQALEEKDIEVLTLGTTITNLEKEIAMLTNKYPETYLVEENNQKTYSDLVCENCELSSKCEALTSSYKMLNDKYRSLSESLDLVKKENIYLNEELIKSSAAATEGVTLDDEETGKLRQNCCKLKAENELLEEKNVELSCQILLLSNQTKQFARYVNPSIDQSQEEQPAVSIQNKEHSLNEGLSRAFSSTTGDVLTQTEEGLPSTISKPTDLLVWHEKDNRKFVEQEEQISNCEKAIAEEKIENLKLTQTIKSLQRELQNSFECFGAKDLAEDMAQTKTQLSQSEAEKALCNTENKNLSQALEEKDIEVLTLGTTITNLEKEIAILTNNYPETYLAEENNKKTYSDLVCENCELSSKCEALTSSNKMLIDKYRNLYESLDLVKKENIYLNEELIKSSAAATEGVTLDDEVTGKLRQNCCKLKAENELLEEKIVELSCQIRLLSNQTKQFARYVNPSIDQSQEEQPAVSIQTKEHNLNEGLSRAFSSTTDYVLTQTEEGLPSTISKPTDLLVWHEKDNRKFVEQEEQISNCEKAIAEEKIENLKLTQTIKSLQRELQNSFDCFGEQGLAEDLAQTKTQLSQSEAEKALCNTENKNLTQALEEKDIEVLTLGTTVTNLEKEIAILTNSYPETYLAEENNQKTYSDLICENCELSSNCESLTSSKKRLNDKYLSLFESLDLTKKENSYLKEELVKISAAEPDKITLGDEEISNLRQTCCKLKSENELLEELNLELNSQVHFQKKQKLSRHVRPSMDQPKQEQFGFLTQSKEHNLNEGPSRAFSSTTDNDWTQTEEALLSTNSKSIDLLVRHERDKRKIDKQEEQISNCEKAIAEEKIENLRLAQTVKSLQRELQNTYERFGANDLAEDLAQTKTQLSQLEAEKVLANTENKNLTQVLEEKDVEVLTLGTTITNLKKEFANLTNEYPETYLAEENNKTTYSDLICENCELSSKCEALTDSKKRLNDKYLALSESLDLIKKVRNYPNEELVKGSAATTQGITLDDEELSNLRQNCCKLKAENEMLQEKNLDLSSQLQLLSYEKQKLAKQVNSSMAQPNQVQPAALIQTKERNLYEGLSCASSSTTDADLTQTKETLASSNSKPIKLSVRHERDTRKNFQQEEKISNYENFIAEKNVEILKLTQTINFLQRELQNSFECFGAKDLAEDLAQTKTQLSQSEAEKALCNTENKSLTQALEEKDVEVLTLGTTITSLKKEIANLTNKYPETHLAEENNQKTYSELVCENCEISSKYEALTSSYKNLNEKYNNTIAAFDHMKREQSYLEEELTAGSSASTEGVTLNDDEIGKLRGNWCKLKAENELLEEKLIDLSNQVQFLSHQKERFGKPINDPMGKPNQEQNDGLARNDWRVMATDVKPVDLTVQHEKDIQKVDLMEELVSNHESAAEEEKDENILLKQVNQPLQRETQDSFEHLGANDFAEDLAQTKIKLSHSEAEKALASSDNLSLSKAIEEKEHEIQILENTITNLKQEVSSLATNLAEENSLKGSNQKTYSELLCEKCELASQCKALENSYQNMNKKYNQTSGKLAALQRENKILQEEMRVLSAAITEGSTVDGATLDKLREDCCQLEAEKELLDESNLKLSGQIRLMTHENKKLNEQQKVSRNQTDFESMYVENREEEVLPRMSMHAPEVAINNAELNSMPQHLQWTNLSLQHEKDVRKIEELEGILSSCQKSIEEEKAEKLKLSQVKNSLQNELQKALEQDGSNDLADEMVSLKTRLSEIESEKSLAVAETTTMRQIFQGKELEMEMLRNTNSNLKQEMASLAETLAPKSAFIENFPKAYSDLLYKNSELASECKTLKEEFKNLKNSNKEFSEKSSLLEKEKSHLIDELKVLSGKKVKTSESALDDVNAIATLREKICHLKAEKDLLNENELKLIAKNNLITKENDSLKVRSVLSDQQTPDIAQLKTQNENLKSELKQLEKLKSPNLSGLVNEEQIDPKIHQHVTRNSFVGKSVYNDLQSRYEIAVKRIEMLELELETVESKFDVEKMEKMKLNQVKSSLQKELQSVLNQIGPQNLVEDLIELKTHLTEITSEMSLMSLENEKLSKKVENTESEKAKLIATNDNLRNEMAKLAMNNVENSVEIPGIDSKTYSDLLFKNCELISENEILKQNIQKLNNKNEKILGQTEFLEVEKKTLKEELQSVSRNQTSLTEIDDDLVASLREELCHLKSENEVLTKNELKLSNDNLSLIQDNRILQKQCEKLEDECNKKASNNFYHAKSASLGSISGSNWERRGSLLMMDAENEVLKDQLENSQQKLVAETRLADQLTNKNEALEKEVKRLMETQFSAIANSENEQILQDLIDSKMKIQAFETEKFNLAVELEKCDKTVEQKQEECQKLKVFNEHLTAELQNLLQNPNKESSMSAKVLAQELSTLKVENLELNAEIAALSEKLEEMKENENALKNELEILESEKEKLESILDNDFDQGSQILDTLQQSNNENAELFLMQKEAEDLKEKLSEEQKKNLEYSGTIDTLQRYSEKLSNELYKVTPYKTESELKEFVNSGSTENKEFEMKLKVSIDQLNENLKEALDENALLVEEINQLTHEKQVLEDVQNSHLSQISDPEKELILAKQELGLANVALESLERKFELLKKSEQEAKQTLEVIKMVESKYSPEEAKSITAEILSGSSNDENQELKAEAFEYKLRNRELEEENMYLKTSKSRLEGELDSALSQNPSEIFQNLLQTRKKLNELEIEKDLLKNRLNSVLPEDEKIPIEKSSSVEQQKIEIEKIEPLSKTTVGSKLSELQEHLESSRMIKEDLNEKLHQSLVTSLAEHSKQDAHHLKPEVVRNTISDLEAKDDSMSTLVAEIQTEVQTDKQKIRKISKVLDTLTEENTSLKDRLASTKERPKLQAEQATAGNDLERLQKNFADSHDQISQLEREIYKLNQEKKNLIERIEVLSKKNEAMHIKTLNLAPQAPRTSIDEQKLADQFSLIKDKEAENAALLSQVKDLNSSEKQSREKIKSLEIDKAKLESKVGPLKKGAALKKMDPMERIRELEAVEKLLKKKNNETEKLYDAELVKTQDLQLQNTQYQKRQESLLESERELVSKLSKIEKLERALQESEASVTFLRENVLELEEQVAASNQPADVHDRSVNTEAIMTCEQGVNVVTTEKMQSGSATIAASTREQLTSTENVETSENFTNTEHKFDTGGEIKQCKKLTFDNFTNTETTFEGKDETKLDRKRTSENFTNTETTFEDRNQIKLEETSKVDELKIENEQLKVELKGLKEFTSKMKKQLVKPKESKVEPSKDVSTMTEDCEKTAQIVESEFVEATQSSDCFSELPAFDESANNLLSKPESSSPSPAKIEEKTLAIPELKKSDAKRNVKPRSNLESLLRKRNLTSKTDGKVKQKSKKVEEKVEKRKREESEMVFEEDMALKAETNDELESALPTDFDDFETIEVEKEKLAEKVFSQANLMKELVSKLKSDLVHLKADSAAMREKLLKELANLESLLQTSFENVLEESEVERKEKDCQINSLQEDLELTNQALNEISNEFENLQDEAENLKQELESAQSDQFASQNWAEEKIIFQATVDNLQNQMEENEQEFEEALRKTEQKEEMIVTLTQTSENLESELKAKKLDLQKANLERDELIKKVESIAQEQEISKSKLAESEIEIKNLEKTNHSSTQQINESGKLILDQKSQIEKSNGERKKMKMKIRDLESGIKKKEAALKKLETDLENVSLELIDFKRDNKRLNSALNESQTQLNRLSNEKSNLETEVAKLKESLREETENSSLTKDNCKQLQADYNKILKELNETKEEDEEKSSIITNLESEKLNLKAKLSNISDDKRSLASELEKCTDDLKSLQCENEDLKNSQSVLKERLEDLKDSKLEKEKSLNACEEDKMVLQESVSMLQTDLANANRTVKNLEHAKDKLLNELKTSKEAFNELENSLNNFTNENEMTKAEQSRLLNQLKFSEKRISDLTGQVEEGKCQLAEIEKQLELSKSAENEAKQLAEKAALHYEKEILEKNEKLDDYQKQLNELAGNSVDSTIFLG